MIRPADNGTLIIEPHHGDGYTPHADILVTHDERLAPIYAEVAHAGRNHEGIADGDTVVFVPHAEEPIPCSEGTVYALSERSVCGVYVDPDEC